MAMSGQRPNSAFAVGHWQQVVWRRIKRVLPASLFGRALLILVLPIVLVQLITAYIFFERHLASISRHLASSLAGEVAWLVEGWEASPDMMQRRRLLMETTRYMGLAVELRSSLRLPDWQDSAEASFPTFEQTLRNRIQRPFTIRYREAEETVQVLILVDGGMLQLEVPRKRLANPTTIIFIGWTLGASLLLLLIATLFLRNQIRPIIRLSEAAEKFGKGQSFAGFAPSGAREVRQAARAFIDMRERIKRQVESRTAMLSGISHDLRTPLTRMKLQLAMLSDDDMPGREELQLDVAEMEYMVEEYLAFARGEGGEEAQQIRAEPFIHSVIEPYQRQQQPVSLAMNSSADCVVMLKPNAMQRALRNIIDNALRYGSRCDIQLIAKRRRLEIMLDDDGPGIPVEQRAEVFQAFRRLERSRNTQTGGAGLGLTIVRDIVHAHGGEIMLDDAPAGGLRVIVYLPL